MERKLHNLLQVIVGAKLRQDREKSRISIARDGVAAIFAFLGITSKMVKMGGKVHEVSWTAPSERISIPATTEVLEALAEKGILYHVTQVKGYLTIKEK